MKWNTEVANSGILSSLVSYSPIMYKLNEKNDDLFITLDKRLSSTNAIILKWIRRKNKYQNSKHQDRQ